MCVMKFVKISRPHTCHPIKITQAYSQLIVNPNGSFSPKQPKLNGGCEVVILINGYKLISVWQALVSKRSKREEQDPSLLIEHPHWDFMVFTSHCTAHLIPWDMYLKTGGTIESFGEGSHSWWVPGLVKPWGLQGSCSPFSPPLVEEVLMGSLVWENSDKWPVCGEGIREKGRGEKRQKIIGKECCSWKNVLKRKHIM